MIGSATSRPAAASSRARFAAAPRGRPAALPLLRRSVAARSGGGGGPVAPELKQEIEDLLSKHRVVLFMKGTKSFPMCGFSGTVVQVLRAVSVGGAELPFATVNILEREDLRSAMKEYSQWPTFPQVYIDGEFFGGCDIILGEEREDLARHFFFGDGAARGVPGKQKSTGAASSDLSRAHLVPPPPLPPRSAPATTQTTHPTPDAYQSGELQETIERVMAT
jgi:monothiol glutaredoxin